MISACTRSWNLSYHVPTQVLTCAADWNARHVSEADFFINFVRNNALGRPDLCYHASGWLQTSRFTFYLRIDDSFRVSSDDSSRHVARLSLPNFTFLLSNKELLEINLRREARDKLKLTMFRNQIERGVTQNPLFPKHPLD